MENLLNNEVVLEGYVNSQAELSHEIYGEKFYKFELEVLRLSENADNIIITMSERLMDGADLSIGSKIKVFFDGNIKFSTLLSPLKSKISTKSVLKVK